MWTRFVFLRTGKSDGLLVPKEFREFLDSENLYILKFSW